ncbi:uncharacterized protein LOC113980085 [Neopelma chrysocephalum]|uniref:uncharacterized protein LOC113980085 n=1 Tax=Neopelma chrysocephalum TaxID=114329 RepID=UPI000FCD3A15|nr:uncharacterized protein LOC113980085 [Neopelma chrysocephalum]
MGSGERAGPGEPRRGRPGRRHRAGKERPRRFPGHPGLVVSRLSRRGKMNILSQQGLFPEALPWLITRLFPGARGAIPQEEGEPWPHLPGSVGRDRTGAAWQGMDTFLSSAAPRNLSVSQKTSYQKFCLGFPPEVLTRIFPVEFSCRRILLLSSLRTSERGHEPRNHTQPPLNTVKVEEKFGKSRGRRSGKEDWLWQLRVSAPPRPHLFFCHRKLHIAES